MGVTGSCYVIYGYLEGCLFKVIISFTPKPYSHYEGPLHQCHTTVDLCMVLWLHGPAVITRISESVEFGVYNKGLPAAKVPHEDVLSI